MRGTRRRVSPILAVSGASDHPPPHAEADQSASDEYGGGGFGEGNHALGDAIEVGWEDRRRGQVALAV